MVKREKNGSQLHNLGKRLVKSPKIHVCDSGLACHLCGADAERLADDSIMAGRLLESFVAGELLKQSVMPAKYGLGTLLTSTTR